MTHVATDYARTMIERTQGRSVAMSSAGVVASETPLASQAGAAILARGGHAVDAVSLGRSPLVNALCAVVRKNHAASGSSQYS